MDRSDDVNNCRSEATLVFSMMPDFIHMGQGVGRKISVDASCANHRCSSLKGFFSRESAALTVVPRRLRARFLRIDSPLEFDSVGVVHQAIQDAVGNRRITDLLMPVRHRHLEVRMIERR